MFTKFYVLKQFIKFILTANVWKFPQNLQMFLAECLK